MMQIKRIVNCPLCGASDYKKLYKNFEGDQLVQCNVCSFVYINPQLTSSELEKKYSQSEHEVFMSPLRMIVEEKRVEKIGKLKPFGKIVDVGCGDGIFLLTAKNLGYAAMGIEPSKFQADFIKKIIKIPVISKPIEKISEKELHADIITMFHVLEHIKNPKRALNKISHLLSNEGLLVIEVPNFNSIGSKLQKGNWWLTGSQHINQFTPKTLSNLLKKTGFKIIKKEYVGIPIKKAVKSSYNIKNHKRVKNTNKQKSIDLKKSSILLKLIYSVLFNLINFLKVGESIRVYAVKEN